MRLKRPNPTLIITKYNKNFISIGGPNPIDLINIPPINAKSRLEKGPLREIRIISLLILLKYMGFIGTGLAHPKLNIKRQHIPIGSICFRGFRVSLPAYSAEGSPKERETLPWAYSCIVIAKRMTTIFIIQSIIIYLLSKKVLIMFNQKYKKLLREIGDEN